MREDGYIFVLNKDKLPRHLGEEAVTLNMR